MKTYQTHNLAVIGDQAIGELRTMTSIAQERRNRQKRSKHTLKTGMGVIYAEDARKMVQNTLNQEIADTLSKYAEDACCGEKSPCKGV
jgi:hypothetical protein